jgi:hypothetical protein
MRFDGVVAAVLFGVANVACSASPAMPAGGDASGREPDGLAEASKYGPSDASTSDSSASAEGSLGDATLPPHTCPRDFPRWDGSVPDGTVCASPDDTDRDSYPDCIDGCPYDPNKIAPGVCGCNIPDVDSDGDGVADCLDECPMDPNNTVLGQCGCVGVSGVPLAAAGAPCTDTACPQTGATCNGAGVCGDRKSCVPCPGGRFVAWRENETVFWYCGGSLPSVDGPTCADEDGGEGPPATWMAAQGACAAKGLTLARLETIDENRFVVQLTTSPLWIGANDLQTPGQWYWSSPTSNSDLLVWEGGADGSRQNSLYFNWASGAPGTNSCSSMSLDGFWHDTDCSQSLAYLCEYLPHF